MASITLLSEYLIVVNKMIKMAIIVFFYQNGITWERIGIKHWENYAARWWYIWSFYGNWHCNSLLALFEHGL